MFIDGIDRLVVRPEQSMREVIEVIDRAELQVALVVDEGRHLLGTITDGDVRRALLRGMQLDDAALTVMNPQPVVAGTDASEVALEALMARSGLRRIPVTDAERVLVGLAVPRSELGPAAASNLVVIMAGGLGTRLEELTKDCPKPLLPVGAKPMLETIVERFVSQGFTRIAIAVNYRADMIMAHFGDGARFGARISYLHEDKRLGTAGALQLLPPDVADPLIVVNGDVLTTIDFRRLLSFHQDNACTATMGVTYHDVQIPYGVVTLTDNRVNAIVEKPVYRYFVNAGIYVLNRACLDYLPDGEYFDMTTLLERLLADGRPVSSYPIHEYWQDVGRKADYERANREYASVFEQR